ncbi:UDP-N-acetylmuramoyl-L-alanyl-D-glutamate--2,6-diaminopimelate ligase [Pseudalkalibacillus salsuginis]|uniref:UDP-N-acetylmuramoyl-L-alanyl-D-glutamate--2, 6-diaminopimelate ligase n=1 Tax=Pseudalkalibacillus salsuginis TaxID=2910972 RepID=UPI001F3A5773|nr:UDP-N-acetylmuramoyl-L-alanyl-D-glutamate--2,6-diaminopimelate ligase [Pseudalkalibacillus salsuginis]MCF6408390.1 UDP-N-acetylmuramoyl-L-alanyl-D-glutamate--2,6-diaminopimelate ligase [Pseudalkalibacillus salsuginis]
MDLQYLVESLVDDEQYRNLPPIRIKRITDSSLDVEQGFLFVAIKGEKTDGHSFINDAIQKGAAAVIGEADITGLPIPYIKVKNSRLALGAISKKFYDNPAKDKIMIGITGTNGKTTTSYLLKHVLESNGISCSLFGTIKNIINGEEIDTCNTTPSVLKLNELLYKSNDQVVILEVSSHGLSQYRLEGLTFDYCLFTNLSHDHLNYHGTMERYFETKASLFFKMKEGGKAIINIDDPWGDELEKVVRQNNDEVYTIGQSSKADLCIEEFKHSSLQITDGYSSFQLDSNMPGLHNLYNAVMAYAGASQFDLTRVKILSSLVTFPGVPGRFNVYKYHNDATVVIDYAHTANAILHCLKAANDYGADKVIHVFGFRGNADTDKRGDMLRIASEHSDHYILTFDDLNDVSENEMIETLENLNQAYGNQKGIIIPDRTEAIKYALEKTSSRDWVVITGKGHETYTQSYSLPTSSDAETIEYLTN